DVAGAIRAAVGDAGDEDAALFVLAGGIEDEWLIAVDHIAEAVAGVVAAADGDDLGLLLREAVATIGRTGVSEDDAIAALQSEAGAAQPGDFNSHSNKRTCSVRDAIRIRSPGCTFSRRSSCERDIEDIAGRELGCELRECTLPVFAAIAR